MCLNTNIRVSAMVGFALLAAGILSLSATRANGEEPGRRLSVSRVGSDDISVDGRLSEPAWHESAVGTGFVQREPNDGSPATEPTEVRVLYNDAAIYVGVRAFDAEPSAIASEIARRDEQAAADEIVIYLDTYLDHTNCAGFGVTPGGSIRDASFSDDSEENVDATWDPVWQVATTIDSLGWTAEFCIPLSQLRFGKAGDTWGFQVQRRIYRKAETVYWSPYGNEASGFVSQFGEISGLVQLETRATLEIRPFSLVSNRNPPSAQGIFYVPSNITNFNGGVDVKYGPNSNLTVDLAINPDFGQVEADPSEVNLTAFESFFPEKRPFFIEGASLFNQSAPGGDIFYSRRIGGHPPGFASVPAGGSIEIPDASTILSAVKMTGKLNDDIGIGLLSAINAAEDGTIRDATGATVGREEVGPLTHFFAGRVQREFSEGTNVVGFSVTAVNRHLADNLKFLPSSEYVGLADGVHRWRDNTYALRWSAAGSILNGSRAAVTRAQRSPFRYYQRPDADHVELDTARTNLSGYAFSLKGGKESGSWQYYGYYERVSPGFDINEMGFQEVADRHAFEAFLKYIQARPKGFIRTLRYDLGTKSDWSTAGERRLTWVRPAHFVATLQNNWTIDFNPMAIAWQPWSTEALRGGPALRDDLWHNSFLVLGTDDRRRVALEFIGNIGGNFDNRESFYSAGPTVSVRPNALFNVSLGLTYTWVRDPMQWVGAFEALGSTKYILAEIENQELRMTLRLNWTIDPSLSVQLYAQPYTISGAYSRYKNITDPRARELADRFEPLDNSLTCVDGVCEVDLDGDAAADLSFGRPDFNFTEFNSNLVVRWEYRPGSVLFIAWQHGRSLLRSDGTFEWRNDFSDLFHEEPDNTVLVKASYWLNI